LVAATLVVAAGTGIVASGVLGHPLAMNSTAWAVTTIMTVLIVVSWTWPLVLFRGDQAQAFHLDEGFFVVLALLVPPWATLLAFALATTAAQIVKRRPLVRSLFNLGEVLLAVALGLLVSRGLSVPAGRLSAANLAAVTLGAAVYFAVSHGAVAAVMATLGTSWRESLLDEGFMEAGLVASGALLGELLASAIRVHPWSLVLVPPIFVALRRAVAALFKAQHDRVRMQGLFQVTMNANRRLRSESVLESLVTSARDLLRCPSAVITDVPPAPDDMAAPIGVNGVQQWLVVSGRRRTQPFDHADRVLLDALAAIGRSAMSNAELYRQVRYERERLASISLSIGEGVCAVDAEGRLTFVNPAAADMVDLPSLNLPIADSLSSDALQAPAFLMKVASAVIRTGREVSEDDVRFPARKGGTVPVSYTASPVLDGGEPVGAVITFQDITERKAHADDMVHFAYHDSLTGLGNRRLLVEHLSRVLDDSTVDGRSHAVIFVDIDRFKSINDSLGHVTGDELLVAIAERIKSTVRAGDLLARFGGDEFIVLLEDVGGIDEAVAAAKRICATVEQPLVLADGYEIVASLSVGITLTEPGQSIDDILRDADVAMYEAKVKGGGGAYKVFDIASMGRRSPERVALEAALRRSIERNELEVYYQPFFSVDSQTITGCEALVRWRHPELGLLGPNRFIALAEETGLILPIGQFVLDQACQHATWIRDHMGVNLPVSVNLSTRQFRQNTLVAEVAAALERHQLEPAMLTLEITETMVMEDRAAATDMLKRLSRLGLRLAIDDFGTGHSSLGYLKHFPVHEIKVDRIFVQGVAENPVDTAIVRSVVELAAAMGMLAVAEGVETVEQLDALRVLGCPVAQGFYFAKPLPAKQFDALVERQYGRPPAPVVPLRGRKVS
jgi:diguanylate cyclase (GGDEF)-like protein/PAS domain S-box-containing protein